MPSDEPAGQAYAVHDLLGGRVRLRQPVAGYRAAIDPVLLAAAVPDAARRVLDLGCGAGAATLSLAVRRSDVTVVGLDLQPSLVDCLAAGAVESGVAGRVQASSGDLLQPPPVVAAGGFDHVIANPPYLKAGTATVSAHPIKAVATVEGAADLPAWMRAAAAALAPGGGLTLVHRADRVDDVFAAVRPCFGSIALFPLWPRVGAPAHRILVRAVRGGRAPSRVLPGLVLHRDDGGYTDEAQAILRDAAALDLG